MRLIRVSLRACCSNQTQGESVGRAVPSAPISHDFIMFVGESGALGTARPTSTGLGNTPAFLLIAGRIKNPEAEASGSLLLVCAERTGTFLSRPQYRALTR